MAPSAPSGPTQAVAGWATPAATAVEASSALSQSLRYCSVSGATSTAPRLAWCGASTRTTSSAVGRTASIASRATMRRTASTKASGSSIGDG